MFGRIDIRIVTLAAVALALLLPATSLASSGSEAYGGPNGQGLAGITGEGHSGDPVSISEDSSSESTATGSLPFTGFDVGVLAAVGIGLTALGFGIRRLNRQPSEP